MDRIFAERIKAEYEAMVEKLARKVTRYYKKSLREIPDFDHEEGYERRIELRRDCIAALMEIGIVWSTANYTLDHVEEELRSRK